MIHSLNTSVIKYLVRRVSTAADVEGAAVGTYLTCVNMKKPVYAMEASSSSNELLSNVYKVNETCLCLSQSLSYYAPRLSIMGKLIHSTML